MSGKKDATASVVYLTFLTESSRGVDRPVYCDENVWLSQKWMAAAPTINFHQKEKTTASQPRRGEGQTRCSERARMQRSSPILSSNKRAP